MINAETVERCRSFIGAKREVEDNLSPEAAEKLATLLALPLGKHLPLCWHWAYFNPAVSPQNVGHDGHERLGVFLPDVPLPRRMWAAGEIKIAHPLEIGVPAKRTTVIADVAFKEGRSGPLCFVTLEHEIVQNGAAIHEQQTIVYRETGRAEEALRTPGDPVPDGYRIIPDTTLVAYSAITQNGHRIHWDRDFCRDVENYPDLVVHGPLLATLLAGRLSTGPGTCTFRFRALAPVFASTPIRPDIPDPQPGVVSRTIDMMRSDGVAAMRASIEGP